MLLAGVGATAWASSLFQASKTAGDDAALSKREKRRTRGKRANDAKRDDPTACVSAAVDYVPASSLTHRDDDDDDDEIRQYAKLQTMIVKGPPSQAEQAKNAKKIFEDPDEDDEVVKDGWKLRKIRRKTVRPGDMEASMQEVDAATLRSLSCSCMCQPRLLCVGEM